MTLHRYRLLLRAMAPALAWGLAACSSAPPVPMGAAVEAGAVPARLTDAQASEVTLYAISLVGTPYRYGGNTPESGFDCSGLIGHVYSARAQVSAPRTVAALVDWGRPVAPAQLRSGDLVVFTQNGVSSHAGIYVGEGRFVHAPSSGGEVRLDRLAASYWARQPVSFRRP